ncbi:hypothetical protein LTR37_000306 [Vermiconidia calcicola]|uniref:Uncharacterized protein n=1 Tax=Vermiconidia calcicola TaxID=1690605 RepID=A0ACC3NZX7_9PEZI|nr:hypothetical protein LTR37_000306 [Vermiconidia calcicola]
MAQQGLEAFYYCATFLASSIEIAAIVVLAKVDFGVSTYGMGDDTVRVTDAVAMIVLLPLVYALAALPTRVVVNAKTSGDNGDSDSARETSSSKFFLFALCWLLALYPFWSALNVAFGPSKSTIAKKRLWLHMSLVLFSVFASGTCAPVHPGLSIYGNLDCMARRREEPFGITTSSSPSAVAEPSVRQAANMGNVRGIDKHYTARLWPPLVCFANSAVAGPHECGYRRQRRGQQLDVWADCRSDHSRTSLSRDVELIHGGTKSRMVWCTAVVTSAESNGRRLDKWCYGT